MATTLISGKVQTVLGPIPPSDMGVTLSHEHLIFDFSADFTEPDELELKPLGKAPVTMDILGWLKYNWRCNLDNLLLLDVHVASEEVSRFARAGGKTIVDTTNIGIGRDASALARISGAAAE